jgi:hypothetical protein
MSLPYDHIVWVLIVFVIPEHYVIVCQLLAAGLWFSPGPPVSSTNKTDSYDITEILSKAALNTMTSHYTRINSLSKYFI